MQVLLAVASWYEENPDTQLARLMIKIVARLPPTSMEAAASTFLQALLSAPREHTLHILLRTVIGATALADSVA